MWADSAVAGSAMVAVGTKKLKARRKIVPDQPRIHSVVAGFYSLLVTAYWNDVIYGKKLRLFFDTPWTRTLLSIVFKNEAHMLCVIDRRPLQERRMKMRLGEMKSLIPCG